jgi:LemA protein
MDVRVTAGLVGLALFVFVVVILYNRLVRLRFGVKTAWSDIDVHLKKRHDLLPPLVQAVKGYAGHEATTLEKLIRLRSAAMGAKNRSERVDAENHLSETLKSLFAVAEAYPDLKADTHFHELMKNVKAVEDNLEHARRLYNASVRDYNVASSVFPTSIVASAFSFQAESFFALAEQSAAREPVKLNLPE